MGVPPVVKRAQAAVGGLCGLDVADVPHLSENSFDLRVFPEQIERLGLLFEQLIQVIRALVRTGQSQQVDPAALTLPDGHRRQDFGPSTFRNLRGADGALPDRTAGLQAAVAGRAVLDGLQNLYLLALLTDAKAVVCPCLWEHLPNNGLSLWGRCSVCIL